MGPGVGKKNRAGGSFRRLVFTAGAEVGVSLGAVLPATMDVGTLVAVCVATGRVGWLVGTPGWHPVARTRKISVANPRNFAVRMKIII